MSFVSAAPAESAAALDTPLAAWLRAQGASAAAIAAVVAAHPDLTPDQAAGMRARVPPYIHHPLAYLLFTWRYRAPIGPTA